MPTYDLKCRTCGASTEVFLTRIIRDDDKVCADCGSTDVRAGIGGGFLGAGTSTSRADSGACPSAPSCPSASAG